MKIEFFLHQDFSIEKITPELKNHFFGFYDLSPWNKSETKILTLEVDFLERTPAENDIAKVCFVDLETKKLEIIGETKAWNWQQGARLQWLGPDFENKIIYNDRIKNQFKSIILDLRNGKREILPEPVYFVRKQGDLALTLNFSRLHKLVPGYGYLGGEEKENLKEFAPKNDGLFLFDLKKKTLKLLFSLKEIKFFQTFPLMENTYHWFSHPTFSPDGQKFVFLHRFWLKDGGFYTRLFVAKTDGSDLKLLLDSGMASHFAWKDNKEIVIWARLPNKLNKLRKTSSFFQKVFKYALPLYHKIVPQGGSIRKKIANDFYILINVETGEIKKIGENLFKEDGHCSASQDGRWMLTDTYPDKEHFRHLFLYNFETKKVIEVGKFYSLPDKKFQVKSDWDISAMRCDLHPRLSKKADKICIDSVHKGTRQMYIIRNQSL